MMVKDMRRAGKGPKAAQGLAILLAVLTVFLLPAGCIQKQGAEAQFYDFQFADGILVIDDISYGQVPDMGAPGNEGRWIFNGKTAEVIGVCGGTQETGGDFTLYAVEGDKTGDLIYALPNRFTFGPYREFLCIRQGAQLGDPTPETISRAVLTQSTQSQGLEKVAETADLALVEALLRLYHLQAPEEPRPGGTYETYMLHLYHKDYPALYFSLRCSYHVETGIPYLKCADGGYRPLPSGWGSLIASSGPEPE